MTDKKRNKIIISELVVYILNNFQYNKILPRVKKTFVDNTTHVRNRKMDEIAKSLIADEKLNLHF